MSLTTVAHAQSQSQSQQRRIFSAFIDYFVGDFKFETGVRWPARTLYAAIPYLGVQSSSLQSAKSEAEEGWQTRLAF